MKTNYYSKWMICCGSFETYSSGIASKIPRFTQPEHSVQQSSFQSFMSYDARLDYYYFYFICNEIHLFQSFVECD